MVSLRRCRAGSQDLKAFLELSSLLLCPRCSLIPQYRIVRRTLFYFFLTQVQTIPKVWSELATLENIMDVIDGRKEGREERSKGKRITMHWVLYYPFHVYYLI